MEEKKTQYDAGKHEEYTASLAAYFLHHDEARRNVIRASVIRIICPVSIPWSHLIKPPYSVTDSHELLSGLCFLTGLTGSCLCR